MIHLCEKLIVGVIANLFEVFSWSFSTLLTFSAIYFLFERLLHIGCQKTPNFLPPNRRSGDASRGSGTAGSGGSADPL